MATITSATPVVVQDTFDQWYITNINIMTEPNRPWSIMATFQRAKELPDNVIIQTPTGNETLLDRNGDPVKQIKLMPRDLDPTTTTRVTLTIEDIQKFARDKSLAGDDSVKNLLEGVLGLLVVEAMTKGLIS